jgi:predicted ABC-class ATPase
MFANALYYQNAKTRCLLATNRPRFAIHVDQRELPAVVTKGLEVLKTNIVKLKQYVDLVEDNKELRQQLHERNLVAFMTDGSLLPRYSGIDDRPLPDAVLFKAPMSLAVELVQPYAGVIRGLGVPEGITLSVGGGFS